jgi:ferric-dicitrate binding protein FerR (iron transport regulator)
VTEQMDWALLAAYLDGECSPAEVELVERWIAADPARREEFELRRRMWTQAAHRSAQIVDTAAGWTRMQARLLTATGPRRLPVRFASIGRPRMPQRWQPIGALLAIAILSGVGAWTVRAHRSSVQGAVAPAQGPMRQYTTKRGERAEIRLMDSSTVTLAPGSTLRIPATFGDSTRDLFLDGEAFFDVRHDGTRPFRVHARDAVVRDLGTKFAVTSYGGGADARIVVSEGRVTVRSPQDSVGRSVVLLTRGQMARLSPAGVATVSHVNADSYVAWAGGQLVFEETPLRDAIAQIGRWYDHDIRLGDPTIGDRLLTASIRGESYPEVLRLLETTLEVRVIHDGGAVVLRDGLTG